MLNWRAEIRRQFYRRSTSTKFWHWWKSVIPYVSLRSGNVPFIRFTWKYHDKWRKLSTWRFYVSNLSFERDQHSNFSRKHRRQNFEEQNECITSLERREKAVESNIEWKKKKAPEACSLAKFCKSILKSNCTKQISRFAVPVRKKQQRFQDPSHQHVFRSTMNASKL